MRRSLIGSILAALLIVRMAGAQGSDIRISPDDDYESEFPAVAVDAGGKVHIVWSDEVIGDNLWYSMLDNSGNTLIDDTQLTTTSSSSSRPAIVVDSEGYVHIVWHDKRGTSAEVYYTKLDPSLDDQDGDAASDAAIAVIDDTPLTPDDSVNSKAVMAAIDGSDNIYVSWQDGDYDEVNPIFFLKMDKDGNILVPAVQVSTAYLGEHANRPHIAVDANGDLHMVYNGTAVVRYETFGSAPNRFTAIEWDTRHHSSPNGPGQFQGVLYENGIMELNFMDTSGAQGSISGVNEGDGTRGVDLNGTPSSSTSYRFTFDGTDYTVASIPFNYITLSSDVLAGTGGDDSSGPLALDFSFSFYGTSYNTVYVSSNGYMSFTDTSPTSTGGPGSFPSFSGDDVIAVLWDDWDPEDSYHIYYTMIDGSDGSTRIEDTVISEGLKSKRPAIAVDGADKIHIVWQDKRDYEVGGSTEIYYTKLDPSLDDRDGDKADPSTITLIDDKRLTNVDDHKSRHPWIAIRPGGQAVHVVWYDERIGGDEDAHPFYMKLDNNGSKLIGDTWVSREAVLNWDSRVPWIAVDSGEKAHIVWSDTRGDDNDIFYASVQEATALIFTSVTILDSFSTQPFPGIDIESPEPEGLEVFGGDLWIADDTNEMLYIYNRATAAIDSFSTDPYSGSATFASDPEGLAFDGTYLWVAGGSDGTLDKVNPNTGGLITHFDLNVTTGGAVTDAEGAAWDGANLWISEDENVFKVNPTDGSLLDTFSFNGLDVEGLGWDGTALLLGDTDLDLIYRIDPTTGNILEVLGDLPDAPDGLAWDGSTIWFSDENSETIHQITSTVSGEPIVPPTEEILTFTGENSSFGMADIHSVLTDAGDEIGLELTTPSGNASRKLQAIRYYIHSGLGEAQIRCKVYASSSSTPGTRLREITQTIPTGLTGFTPFQKGVVNLSLNGGTTFYIALGYISGGNPNLGVADGVNPLLQTKQFLYDGSNWKTAQQAGVLANRCVMIEGVWGIKGDLNDSGTVNLADGIRVVDFLLGRGGALSDFEAFEADMEDDGEVNLGDVVQIIDVVLGGI